MRRVRVRKLYADFEQTYMRMPRATRWNQRAEKINWLRRLFQSLGSMRSGEKQILHVPSERRQLKKRWMLYRMLDSNRMLVRGR